MDRMVPRKPLLWQTDRTSPAAASCIASVPNSMTALRRTQPRFSFGCAGLRLFAVGTALASRPPPRSVLAALPHTALTSEDSGTALLGPRVKNAGFGEPRVGNVRHPVPVDPGFVTTSAQASIPQPRALGAKRPQCPPVSRHGMVHKVPLDHRSQPRSLVRHGMMHALPQLCFDLMKFCGKPLLHGGAANLKRAVPVPTTRVRQTQKIERFSLAPAKAPTVPVRKTTESDQAGLFRMKFQREPLEPLAQCCGKAFCLIRVLKSDDEIVGPSNDDDIAFSVTLPPVLCPKVEHVVEVDVGEQRRDRRPLRGSLPRSLSIFPLRALRPSATFE